MTHRQRAAALVGALAFAAVCAIPFALGVLGHFHGMPPHVVADNGDDLQMPHGEIPFRPGRPMASSISARIASESRVRASLHVATDRPIYRSGETVFFRAVALDAFNNSAISSGLPTIVFEVLSPKGDTVHRATARCEDSVAAGSWVIPREAPGGDYSVRAKGELFSKAAGVSPSVRRTISVRAYRAPRMRVDIEWSSRGYAPGEEASALVACTRSEGGACAGAKVVAVARDATGAMLAERTAVLDALGQAVVHLDLPATMSDAPGATVTAAIDDAGTLESRTLTLPLVASATDVAVVLLPEGGDMVAGVAQRVYFEARSTSTGDPVDVSGDVVDVTDARARAVVVAGVRTEHEGRGAFWMTPKAGSEYELQLTRPFREGAERAAFRVPRAPKDSVAAGAGLVLTAKGRTYSHAEGVSVRVSLSPAAPSNVTVRVVLSKREKNVDAAEVLMGPGKSSDITLHAPEGMHGVMRATLFIGAVPVAERLVFVRPPRALRIELAANPASATPRSRVTLTLRTVDSVTGEPVSAVVGLSATDDSVLSLVERRKRAPRLPAMALLEGEVQELQDAEAYLVAAGENGVDLLLGTQGWRRFAYRNLEGFVEQGGDLARSVIAFDERVREFHRNLAFPNRIGGVFPQARLMMGADTDCDQEIKIAVNEMATAVPMAEPAAMAVQIAPLDVAGQMGGAAEAGNGAAVIAEGDMPPPMAFKKVVFGSPIFAETRVYAYFPPQKSSGEREENAQTVYWAAGVRTGVDGKAEIEFGVGDLITSFRVFADAFSGSGALGAGETLVECRKPFYIEPKLPLFLTSGDHTVIPVAIVNDGQSALDVNLHISVMGEGVTITGGKSDISVSVPAGKRTRRSIEVEVAGASAGMVEISLVASAGTETDSVRRNLTIERRGFPIALDHGGVLDNNAGGGATWKVDIPDTVVGTPKASVKLYATPAANLAQALEALIREPSGCFEQTSSTTYPATMALHYMTTHAGVSESLVKKAREVVASGYKRLLSFEVAGGGFEWFGDSPAHEALTAYGLLEFMDMEKVYPVDQAMLKRTRSYLMGQRLDGGFKRNSKTIDSFGAAPDSTTNAYILWSLTYSGVKEGLETQIEAAVKACETSSDPYYIGLVAGTLLNIGDKARGVALASRLKAYLQPTGKVSNAVASITLSGGDPLAIETTSIAVLSWLTAADLGEESFMPLVEAAMGWLATRCADGKFGSTQGTVLALKAVIAYDLRRARFAAAFTAELRVDGQQIGTVSFDPSEKVSAPIEFADFGSKLGKGKSHVVELLADCAPVGSKCALRVPFSSRVDISADAPDDTDPSLELKVSMGQTVLREGDSTTISVNVTNKMARPHGMIVAIVGLPGGMEVRHERLKELAKVGSISFYETVGREVVLYWRSLGPAASHQIVFDAAASVPGAYIGQASRAYEYYNDANKAWVKPLSAKIVPFPSE